VKELQRQGHAILGLSVGEPDFNTPKEICDAAYKAMLEGHTHYTDNMGMV
jgi:aspartate/methionine/tyrosine aminotransferase